MTKWTRQDDGTEVVDCENVDEFLSVLDPAADDWGWMPTARRHRWIFRGQADSTWRLVPTAWRTPPSEAIAAARAEMSRRFTGLPIVSRWDHTGTLPPPPVIDLDVARRVAIQGNAEHLLITDFVYRADELGLAPLDELPYPVHHDGRGLDFNQPVAADDFLLNLKDLPLVGALAQHHGVPTRLLDWSDDALTAAYFASAGGAAERLAVWALDEQVATTHGMPLWGEATPRPVGMSLRVVRPPRSGNPYLRAQRGSFTVPWGAGCYALINNGEYPTLEDFAVGLGQHAAPILRRVTLPTTEAALLRLRLEQRRVARDHLMPSLDIVAREVDEYWSSRERTLGGQERVLDAGIERDCGSASA